MRCDSTLNANGKTTQLDWESNKEYNQARLFSAMTSQYSDVYRTYNNQTAVSRDRGTHNSPLPQNIQLTQYAKAFTAL